MLASSSRRRDQSREHAAQILPAVESVLNLSQVTSSILFEIKGMVRSRDRRLEVAENGIDPIETHNVGTLAFLPDNGWGMETSSLGNCTKAGQSVAYHCR